MPPVQNILQAANLPAVPPAAGLPNVLLARHRQRLPLSYVAIAVVGDTQVGTFSRVVVPSIPFSMVDPVGFGNVFKLTRVVVYLRRKRTVWNQDSDCTLNLSGPQWLAPEWTTAPNIVPAESIRSVTRDFSLVDYSLNGDGQPDVVNTVSSWQPFKNHIFFEPPPPPSLNLLDPFNQVVWNSQEMTIQPNVGGGGVSGFLLGESELAAMELGVVLNPVTPPMTVAAAYARMAANPFTITLTFEVAKVFQLWASYIELFWDKSV